jgi:hypothetical protein
MFVFDSRFITVTLHGVLGNFLTTFLLISCAVGNFLLLVLGPKSPIVVFLTAVVGYNMIYLADVDWTLRRVSVPDSVNESELPTTSRKKIRNKKKNSHFGNNELDQQESLELTVSAFRMSFGEIWFIWMLGIYLFFSTGHLSKFSAINVSRLLFTPRKHSLSLHP